jgi:hypothetical protein
MSYEVKGHENKVLKLNKVLYESKPQGLAIVTLMTIS